MLAHHLVGRHVRDLPYFLGSQELVCPSHGYSSISLDIGAHFFLPFVPRLSLFGRRVDLLD